MNTFGELARKFARKALVPFHEPPRGLIARSLGPSRFCIVSPGARNARRGAAADSIHNPTRERPTLTEPAAAARAKLAPVGIPHARAFSDPQPPTRDAPIRPERGISSIGASLRSTARSIQKDE